MCHLVYAWDCVKWEVLIAVMFWVLFYGQEILYKIILTNIMWDSIFSTHFEDEEIEAQRYKVTYRKEHSQNSNPDLSDLENHLLWLPGKKASFFCPKQHLYDVRGWII